MSEYTQKNNDRKLQDRRSRDGKFAREMRRGCGGKFGRMPARVANIYGYGTPNWRHRAVAEPVLDVKDADRVAAFEGRQKRDAE